MKICVVCEKFICRKGNSWKHLFDLEWMRPSTHQPSYVYILIKAKEFFRNSSSFLRNVYVTVPRKQLNQDFSTNMLLKIYLCIILMLTMAPNIPQCTLKMLVIQPGPPFHFNEVEMVKKRDWASKKVVRSWLKFSLKLRILTQFTSVRDLPIFLGEIIHLINMSV